MPIDNKSSIQYPEINYERSTKYSSTPQLDPQPEPIKASESRAVNQKTQPNPRRMKRKEDVNPPTNSYKK
jgi:hypothetical protein